MKKFSMWKKSFRRTVCAVSAAAVLGTTAPAAHAIEPATIVAAAAAAKEAYDKAKGFLEFVGFLKQPDKLAELSQKLDVIQESINQISDNTLETVETVRRLEQADVRDANLESLDEYLNALEDVTTARIALSYLSETPADADLQFEADNASRLAIQAFESRPRIFRAVGTQANDERFVPVLAMAGYFDAIALRVGTIQAIKGERGFTREPYRSELRGTAKKLRDTVTKVYSALQFRSQLYGRISSFECYGATVFLLDNIRFDKTQVLERENQVESYTDLPGSCEQGPINFALGAIFDDLQAARAAEYATGEMIELADRLDNYASYGQPNAPDYRFPDWIVGSLYNKETTATFIPGSDPDAGTVVRVAPPSQNQGFQLPLGLGPIMHLDSKLCMTSTSAASFTLEPCTGAADQLWTRMFSGNVVHKATGLCLSGKQVSSISKSGRKAKFKINTMRLGAGQSFSSRLSSGQAVFSDLIRNTPRISDLIKSGTIVSDAVKKNPNIGDLIKPDFTPGKVIEIDKVGKYGDYLKAFGTLNLARCDAKRADQVWSTTDATDPGPIVR